MRNQNVRTVFAKLPHCIKPLAHKFPGRRKDFRTQKLIGWEEGQLLLVKEIQEGFVYRLGGIKIIRHDGKRVLLFLEKRSGKKSDAHRFGCHKTSFPIG